jgi:hypothetical protein
MNHVATIIEKRETQEIQKNMENHSPEPRITLEMGRKGLL